MKYGRIVTYGRGAGRKHPLHGSSGGFDTLSVYNETATVVSEDDRIMLGLTVQRHKVQTGLSGLPLAGITFGRL